MTRFNYAPPRFAALGSLRLSLGHRSLRGPLSALAASFVLVAMTSIVQATRLQALDRERATIVARQAVLEPALARLRADQRAVTNLEQRAAVRGNIRASGGLSANEIASIGNALPVDAWLTAVRVAPHTIALEGRAARVDTVAATLSSLERVHGVLAVRLVSAHADGARPIVTYAIEVERSR